LSKAFLLSVTESDPLWLKHLVCLKISIKKPTSLL